VALHSLPYHLLQYVYTCLHTARNLIAHPPRYIHDPSEDIRHIWAEAGPFDMSGHIHHLLRSLRGSTDNDPTHHVPMVSGCWWRRRLCSCATHVLRACTSTKASRLYEHGHFRTCFVFGHRSASWRWNYTAWKLAMDLPCQVSYHFSSLRNIAKVLN
jgi:hypothetical protein